MLFPPAPRPSDLPRQSHEDFVARFLLRFSDSAFDPHREILARLAEIAWQAHLDGRKSPHTHPAGKAYQDPDYALAEDWRAAAEAIDAAAERHRQPQGPDRILVISASDRNDHSCPGEESKSRRLMSWACEALSEFEQLRVEKLDLSRMISDYGRQIYPCKGCVSTAMPLCHWPCSCYPNYALGQVGDWMNEIYPLWVEAHGILIVTPVYWYAPPSALKLMIDRLVCADGGNPDPTRTQGKDARKAKALELEGWDYPKHLAGRLFAVFVHGDAAGSDHLRMTLTSWLKDMELLPAGLQSDIARYIGYYEPYATSHQSLDKDQAVRQEITNMAKGLALAVRGARRGALAALQPDLEDPRPK